MVQVRERTTLERPPAPIEEKPSRDFRWLGWLIGIVVVAGVAGLIWWGLSESQSEPTAAGLEVLQEDFTGVDEFVAERTAAVRVVLIAPLEDFTGVDEFVAERTAAARVAPIPPLEDFTGVDEFVAERTAAARVAPIPPLEDFTGLD